MKNIDRLRALPSVEELLSSGTYDREIESLSRPVVTSVVRKLLQKTRSEVKKEGKAVDLAALTREIKRGLNEIRRRRIGRVINGTGILIHTNLGRAPLGVALLEKVRDRVSGYNTLEYDLASGKRGQRGTFLSYLFAELTGFEAAVAVNNNAAALFLILNTFANRKEVVVSRSELVQIGGGFRIPDIIRKAGAKLVEVGTTNKTNKRDYLDAISARTTLLLKVHRSNFSLDGFVEEVAPEELAQMAKKKNLLSVYDLGSGSYHQTEKFKMAPEPNVIAALRTGADIVCFSGDKLFGSTQAGIILGARDKLEKLHRNPIYRTLRLDKLSIALLEETVFAYLRKADKELLPLWRMIAAPMTHLQARAQAIKEALQSTGLQVAIEGCFSTPGGGSLPGGRLESTAVVIRPKTKTSEFHSLLLSFEPPLIGYIENDRLHLDLRTVDPIEDREVIQILTEASSCTP